LQLAYKQPPFNGISGSVLMQSALHFASKRSLKAYQ
jgi:hypothetical protein